VTDAMLRKQDDGDWLMIRRDYHASDFQPTERDHAGQRQGFNWSIMHLMKDPEHQPAPIVHNGIIYFDPTPEGFFRRSRERLERSSGDQGTGQHRAARLAIYSG